MELVYLWVKEYKNIEKQGFNFSPRFECEFKDNELTITKKEDYVNIFPENINITAIVGENGSGKSSLLNAITNEGIVIYKNKKFFANQKYKIIGKVNEILNFDNELSIIHINSDLMKINHIKDAWDAYRMNMYDENEYIPKGDSSIFTGKINIKAFEIRIIELINKHTKSFQNNLFHFNPRLLKVSFSPFVMPVDIVEKQGMYSESEKLLLRSIGREMLNIRDNGRNIYEKLLSFFFTKNAFIDGKLSKKFLDIKKIMDMDKLEIKDYTTLLSKEYITNAKKLFNFLEKKNVFDSNFIINDFFTDLDNVKYKDIFFKLIEIDFLRIDFIDDEKNSINYFDLSQGERTFFNESLMIFDKIKETDKKDILIALDEPEMSLHPEWQKKYINELLKLLKNFPEKKFQIVITSHSPFILSDLPRENVIFLKKDKETGQCLNVTKETKLITFGSNIHTLLADGFFMSDGLMGEFAKGKIDEIKKFYDENKDLKKEDVNFNTQKIDYESKKERFNHIQSIIGEPFLKTVIKNYLDELYLIFSDDNTLINKELEELEKRQEYLKSLKND